MTWLFAILAAAVWCGLVVVGITALRDGDQPADARVTAVLAGSGQPDETRPVVVATVRNPSGVPVMVGLRVRARLTAGTLTARVPWRTVGRRYRASEQDTVGVVPAGESAVFGVPAPASGRRYRLVALIGQEERRLRVLTVPVRGTRGMERVVMEQKL
jgi:hypothetical protein